MNALALASDPRESAADSGVRAQPEFLEVNLESLRIGPDTRQALRDSAPRGRVVTLSDGTSFIEDGEARLGMPIAPADVFAQLAGVDASNVVVIFGVGTGQVPRAARAMCKVPIVIYEPDPAVLRTLLEFGPLDLGDAPVASCVSDLTRIWRDFAMRSVDVRVLTTPGYYKAYPEQVREFVEAIPSLLQRAAISKATYHRRGKVWIEDIIANVELLTDAPPFLTLQGRYEGVPAFIIGAGPSLDKNVRLLGEAARKGIVFATNTGALSLAKHGIEPQVVACIESIDASSKLSTLPFISRSIRAFSLSGAPQTLRTGTGPLLPLHEAVPQYAGPLEELTGAGGVPMSGSVSTVAFGLARMLGCSPIVLVGQDLAYSGGRTYAIGTGYETSAAKIDEHTGVISLDWNDEIQRVHGNRQGTLHASEELRRVPAWGGQGDVDSGAAFMGVHVWFESTAELMKKSGSTIRLINATEGGVHLDGYEDVPLARMLAEMPERAIGASDMASLARSLWTPLQTSRIVGWLESHAAKARVVRRAARRVRRLALLAARATVHADARGITRVYDALEAAEAKLRVSVVSCPLVDAWSHGAIDRAMHEAAPAVTNGANDPQGAAQAATEKSARVAGAVEQSARELEVALNDRATQLGQSS
jgi:hypothetical protein